MDNMKKLTADQAESLKTLAELLPIGATVYCIVRSVARSGMSRKIDFYCKERDESRGSDVRWITPHMVRLGVMDQSYASYRKSRDSDGARIDGGGMDMCFESVYRLGRVLFPDGFAQDGRGRNGDTSGWDRDGGYALKHRTL